MKGSIGPQFMPNVMPTKSTMDSIDDWVDTSTRPDHPNSPRHLSGAPIAANAVPSPDPCGHHLPDGAQALGNGTVA
jgi:hypothetical protein